MSTSQPEARAIRDVQRDLDRLGATCSVCSKFEPRGRWIEIADGVETFEAALDYVPKLLETATEVGIFLDHAKYGGIMIWTSICPEVVNRFQGYDLDP